MSSLALTVLPINVKAIHPYRLYEELKKLGERFSSPKPRRILREQGLVPLVLFIGDGSSTPDRVFYQSWYSVKHWVGVFDDVNPYPLTLPGYVDVNQLESIMSWIKRSRRNVVYFIDNFPSELTKHITLEEQELAGGRLQPEAFRIHSESYLERRVRCLLY